MCSLPTRSHLVADGLAELAERFQAQMRLARVVLREGHVVGRAPERLECDAQIMGDAREKGVRPLCRVEQLRTCRVEGARHAVQVVPSQSFAGNDQPQHEPQQCLRRSHRRDSNGQCGYDNDTGDQRPEKPVGERHRFRRYSFVWRRRQAEIGSPREECVVQDVQRE